MLSPALFLGSPKIPAQARLVQALGKPQNLQVWATQGFGGEFISVSPRTRSGNGIVL